MPLPDPASRQRLAEMGIEVWTQRRSRLLSSEPADDERADEHANEPRVRLAAGRGSWLLVQRRPWDGRHAGLLADLQALLGVEDCRFGQWADSREAGQGLSELPERGVRHVLAFGAPPPVSGDGVVELPALDEVAASAAARRALWQALRPLLVV